MKNFTKILMVTVALLLTQFAIQAQTTTGRLVGSVAGSDGAVIPGATVVLTDSQTGKERTTTTNAEGSFSFPLLDVGAYSVKVTAKGFKTSNATIKVEVGQEYSLNVEMTVGEISENVTVTAGADIINSTTAELNSTISNRQITELPLATRNPLALLLTQSGAASNPSQNTSINGSRTSATNITRDGVNIQDNFIRSNATDFAPGRPSVDNVEEFTLSAQGSLDSGFGAAQVNFVTPRGGNQFTGALWAYNRNSKFGANSFFANAGGNYGPTNPAVIAGFRRDGEEINPRPFRNRNQYGFKVSGPIFKNKLFFFAYGEKLKDIVQSSRLVTTLTPTARAGIFRFTAGGVTYSANIFTPGAFTANPANPAPAPIPTTTNGAVSTQILSLLPGGNSFEVGDGLNTTGARYFQKANQDRKSLTGRLDYDLNDKNNFNFVGDFNYEENLRNDVDTFNVTPVVLQPARVVLFSGGWRYSPTSNISNELRVGRIFSKPDFFRTDAAQSSYFTPTLVSFTTTFRDQGRSVSTVNAQDTMTWLTGNHSFRFGAQYQRVFISAYNDAGNKPSYTFGLSSTGGPVLQSAVLQAAAGSPTPLSATQQGTARNLFALLGGVIASGQQTFNVTSQTSGFVSGATNLRQFKYWMLAPYVLDQWRVKPNLTVNLGLRYDYQAPLVSPTGLYWEPVILDGQNPAQAALDPAGTFQFIGGNAGGRDKTFYKPDRNNWAPSFGVAWAPKDIGNGFLKMLMGDDFVVRGGYRASYVNDELVRAPDNALGNHPGFASTLAALRGGTTTALDDRFGQPFTSTIATPSFVTSRSYTTNNTAGFSNTGTVFAIDPNLETPLQHDYSFGVQRRFGSWVGEARYVGSRSTNMLRTIDYNQIILSPQYKADFATVRNNVLAGCATAAACAAGAPTFLAMGNSGGVVAGANLSTLNTFGSLVLSGQIAELAWQQIVLANIPNPNVVPYPAGTLRAQFLANPNAGVVNVLENGGSFFYNSGQFELRRRFEKGLYLQANYTFAKELTDAIGTGQTRVEPFLDNNNRRLDYARADFDQTHVFNVNAIYELPFGKNKRWLNSNKYLDQVIGGWQLGLVWRVGSGAPITFTDSRGTLNRAGRSGRQTALTSLSDSQLKKLLGVFNTPCGIFYVNPTAININQANLAAGNCTALTAGVPTGIIPGTTVVTSTVGGAGASGFGQPTFPGQVFFNNGPNQTSGLRRAIVNGPWFSSADLSLLKNFSITERVKFQIRGEAYNFTNTPYFAPGQFIDINSTSFGRITGVSVGARVVQFAGRLTF